MERSRTDPSMLIITYTAEHNHPWPSHRNALAGSSRMSSLEKGGSTVTQELEKTEEMADAVSAVEVGPAGSAANSPVNSPDFSGAGEEPDLVSGMSPEFAAVVIDDQIVDTSEPFLFESEKDPMEDMMMHHGSLHLSSRPTMNMEEDFFAELGELPDTNFMFGRTGLVEDRSDDECGNLGIDNVDPYNLFGWSTAAGSYLESNVVM